MAKMTVLQYPDERLRKVAQKIEKVDDNIRSVIDDMFETMYEEQGVGLAATQVDVHRRLFVSDCSEDQNEPLVFINPEITEAEGHFKNDEGCLSFPGVYAKVERAEKITVTALDKNGERFSRSAEGLLAICIQHEIDQLHGKTFLNRFNRQTRRSALRNLRRKK